MFVRRRLCRSPITGEAFCLGVFIRLREKILGYYFLNWVFSKMLI